MLKKLGTMIVAGLALGAATLGMEVQQRKPTVEISLRPTRKSPPETLTEFIGNVDLTVHVRILSSEPRRRPVAGGFVSETLFVAEVIGRGRSYRLVQPGDKLRLIQGGGEFEEANEIRRYVEEGHPPLVTGRSYILALNWNDFLEAFLLPYGPDSVFEIQGGKVHPRGKGTAARELSGKELKEALLRIK